MKTKPGKRVATSKTPKIPELQHQVSELRERFAAAKKRVAGAKENHKRAKKTFKLAKREAKRLRKQLKSLKRTLDKATVAAISPRIAAAKKNHKAKKKPLTRSEPKASVPEKKPAARRVEVGVVVAKTAPVEAAGALPSAVVAVAENSGADTAAKPSALSPGTKTNEGVRSRR